VEAIRAKMIFSAIADASAAAMASHEKVRKAQRHGPGRKTFYTARKKVELDHTPFYDRSPLDTRQPRRAAARVMQKIRAHRELGSTKHWREVAA
jgi:hypothetical protein